MTLDEAIKHAEEVADEKKKEACNLYDAKVYEESRDCIWCSEEHRQLAEWLKEQKMKEQDAAEDQEWGTMEERLATMAEGDCRYCKEYENCPCGKDGHENGTSQGYSTGECKYFKLKESEE